MTVAALQPENRILFADGAPLEATVVAPTNPRGVVLFAHGSHSNRSSGRKRYVASILARNGFAVVCPDLLTRAEVNGRPTAFDIPLLAERLLQVADWVRDRDDIGIGDVPLGYFGGSTGAAAALFAAAGDGRVGAVVSRGGRVEMAGAALDHVQAPTLLIVGGADVGVVSTNRRVARRLRGTTRVRIIPGATHLFPEPGALPEVARLATEWFTLHLR